MMYTVWIEGYAATGEQGTARFVGRVDADSFEEAVAKLHHPGWGNYTPGHDGKPPTFWGCRLFNSEAEARRSFG